MTQGAVLANTYTDNGSVTVSNPSWSTTSTLQFAVNVEVTPDTTTDLTLATWLTAAPSSPSSIRSGETYSAAGLWTAWANGSTTASGFTYTQKNNAGNAALTNLWKSYKVSITVPNESQTYGGITYPVADVVAALQSEKVDISLARNGDDSKAMFFTFAAAAVENPAQGATSLSSATTYATTGISLSGIGTSGSIDAYFGLYVDAGSSVQTGGDTVSGNFTVSVSHHA